MKISDIKKQAKLSLQGNYIKAILEAVFYTVIIILIQFLMLKLSKTNNYIFYIISLLISFLALPFSFGLISSLINISKGEKNNITDFINITLLNYTKIIKLIFNIILRLFPYVLACIIFLTLFILKFENDAIHFLFFTLLLASLFILFIRSLDYVFFNFITFDDKTKKEKDILNESKKTIKNNKLKFIGLVLSFIGYYIIFALITKIALCFLPNEIIKYIPNLLSALLTPYFVVSQYMFYEDIKNNK